MQATSLLPSHSMLCYVPRRTETDGTGRDGTGRDRTPWPWKSSYSWCFSWLDSGRFEVVLTNISLWRVPRLVVLGPKGRRRRSGHGDRLDSYRSLYLLFGLPFQARFYGCQCVRVTHMECSIKETAHRRLACWRR